MRVIFRESQGIITAVFLNEVNHHSRLELVCYERIGQHGGCCIDWVYHSTKPAKPDEYSSLLKELESLGYSDLQVVNRLPSKYETIQNINQQQRRSTS